MGTHMDGTGEYWAKLDGILETRAKNAKRVMDEIGHNTIRLTDDSVQAFRSPRAVAAVKDYVENGLASIDPEVRNAAVKLNQLIDGVLDNPAAQTVTVREAQDVSEALLSGADLAYRGGDNAKGKALKGLGRAIRDNARDKNLGGVEQYDQFLKQYVTDSEAKRAYDLGALVLTPGLKNSPEKVRIELGKMGADAWDHFRKGVGESLLNKIGEANGDTKVIRDLVRGDNFRERVGMAFRSPVDFEDFLTTAERRLHATELSNQYLHNSRTFGRDQAAKAMNDAGADPLGTMAEAVLNPRSISDKALKALIKQGGDKTLLTALGNPRANAAMGRTANNPAELQALLQRLADYRRLNAAPRLAGRAGLGGGSSIVTRRTP